MLQLKQLSKLSTLNQLAAEMIFFKKAFKFGAFPLKLHEKNPNAPLSPFFVSIRNKHNPTKPGTLESYNYDLIALCLLQTIEENKLKFDAIVGIPRAGDPIVDGIEKIIKDMDSNGQWNPRRIRLDKDDSGDKRKIVSMPGFEYKIGERVLLIDDLVTKADTKLEAISAIESVGSKVVGLVVFIDREQGGKGQIERAGYKMFAALTITELLDFYVNKNLVSEEKYQEAINYIKQYK